jgi:HK97 family phage major capsid protein
MEFNEQEKALLEAIKAKTIEAVKSESETLKSDLMKEIEALKKSDNSEELKNVVIKIEAELKAMKEQGSKQNELPTIKEVLIANKENLKKLKDGDMSGAFKAVGNMSITGNVTGEVPQAQRLAGLNDIASRSVRFLDMLQRNIASSNLISWVYKSGREGAAGQTAEAAAKNQIDFDLLVGSQKVEKTTAFIKVTDEMLEDIDFIESEINNELTNELLRAVETQAYSGNGTSPQLNGVRTVASTFAAGSFALAIDNANEVDVLVVAANQIAIANQSNPNAIFMHPTDVTRLKVTKLSSSDKRYVERLMMVGGTLSMDGIPIIPTTLVTAGQYLIGDFSKALLFEKGGLSIEMGYDADDFTKNFRTIRAEWRGAVVVKNNDRTAFVKGVFATDKAALETV